MSAILRCSFNVITFNDFAGKIYAYIIDIATGYDRVDKVCDKYFENSLKSLTRHDHKFGLLINFDGNSEFLTDFKDNFMKNPKNKENLNHYLTKKFLEIHNPGIIMAITIENGILTNDATLRTDPVISSCSAEEANQKLVLHMLQCLLIGIKTMVIKTVDADVFLLLLAYRHSGGNFSSKVFVWLGIGKLNSCFYLINDIALDLGEKACEALPFFHAYTGCDTVSSFFNHGECK